MIELEYRKVDQSEIPKMTQLAKETLEFHLHGEDLLENWNNIDSIGGFEEDKLLALLTTDPHQLITWTSDKKFKASKEKTIQTAILLKPVIHPDLLPYEDSITTDLMNTYFDNLSCCDELVLYTTAELSDTNRRNFLTQMGFVVDSKFPKKMVLKSKWDVLLEKKLSKILSKIKLSLKNMGLECEDIDKNLICTELLNIIIYILVDQYEGEHSIIKFFGYLAAIPEISEELIRFLLEMNFHNTYGSFCIDMDCNLLIINNKLGPSISIKDIELALKSIAMAIDKYNDVIVSQFGAESLCDCVLRQRPSFPANHRYLLEQLD